MKKVVKGFASVILASIIFVVGCKQTTSTSEPSTGGSEPQITVTVQGDEHVDNIITKTLSVAKGSKWSAFKSQIKVTYKNGFVHASWKLNNADGDDLKDDYQFEQDTTVYVLSKNTVTLSIKGDERINLQQTTEKPYNTAWSSIKAEIEDIKKNIQPSTDWKDDWNKGDYGFYEWRLGDENGEKITDDYRFTDNTTIYAVSNYKKWKTEDDGSGNKVLSGVEGSEPRGKIILPDGVTSIGDSTFSGCRSLTTIEIPAGVTSIGEFTFEDCSSLKTIKIPKSVTSIGASAFSGCTNLGSIEIPARVESIEDSTFSGCHSLTTIEIPADVKSIGRDAFFDCRRLTTIKIPADVTLIGESAFYGCSSLTSATFADPEGWKDYSDNIVDVSTPQKAIEALKKGGIHKE